MSDFAYNGTSRKLKVASVSPSLIGKLFKLDEQTIVICDVNEGDVHLPEGNRFEPPLIDGHSYEVDGTELAAIEAKQATEMALQIAQAQVALAAQVDVQKRARDVAVIKGKERENLVGEVVASTKALNESAGMLYHAPQAVVLIEALAILAGAAPDPSLVNGTMEFKRLKTPTSFKASLYQVAANMCDAFRAADNSMMTIKASLSDLPTYFVATIEVAGEKDDVAAQKILKRTTDKITQASERCVQMAKNASKAFNEVIADIDELCQASINAKGTNEKTLQELKNLKVELDQKKQTLEQEEKALKEQHEETKARANEALAEYKEQVKNSGNLGKMFLAMVTDGLMETVKAVAALPAKTLDKLGQVMPAMPNTEKSSTTMRYAMESSLLQMLEKVIEDLASPGELNDEMITDYIRSFNNAERYSSITEEGKEIYKKAKAARKFLEKNEKNLKDQSLKKSIDELRVAIRNVVVAAKSVREDRQKAKDSEMAAKLSFAEKLVQAETDQIKMAQSHYSEESRKEETLRKERKENQMELSNLLAKLQNLKLEEVDLGDIISYLREGIEYLGKVKENWNELTKFFDTILIIVETNLKGNIDSFVVEAKDPASRRLMLQSALKATGYCIQVGNCAQIYTQVSNKYVMPAINGIGKQFALTNAEARAKKGEIQNILAASVQGVGELIDAEKKHFEDRFEEQMEAYADTYALCVTDQKQKALGR